MWMMEGSRMDILDFIVVGSWVLVYMAGLIDHEC
ncbi:hypothetical protein ES702_02475 [subsurface metagenome]